MPRISKAAKNAMLSVSSIESSNDINITTITQDGTNINEIKDTEHTNTVLEENVPTDKCTPLLVKKRGRRSKKEMLELQIQKEKEQKEKKSTT